MISTTQHAGKRAGSWRHFFKRSCGFSLVIIRNENEVRAEQSTPAAAVNGQPKRSENGLVDSF